MGFFFLNSTKIFFVILSDMELEILYFSWESLPAVIAGSEEANVSAAFFLPLDEDSWRVASGEQYADITIDGANIDKSEFEKKFGVIGDTLPELPRLA
tara:strand:+ start:93 stop:386 length:294 start_codon:yes stop_codon:yes gene_type:complete